MKDEERKKEQIPFPFLSNLNDRGEGQSYRTDNSRLKMGKIIIRYMKRFIGTEIPFMPKHSCNQRLAEGEHACGGRHPLCMTRREISSV